MRGINKATLSQIVTKYAATFQPVFMRLCCLPLIFGFRCCHDESIYLSLENLAFTGRVFIAIFAAD